MINIWNVLIIPKLSELDERWSASYFINISKHA